MIKRYIEDAVFDHLEPNKVVVIYGPRRAGKTTLLTQIRARLNDQVMWVTGEERSTREWLGSQESLVHKRHLGDKTILIIDEAQKVDQIGLNLKIMVDMIPGIKILASGSSSFDLANQVGEPLVGRKWQFELYPLSQMELGKDENFMETSSNLSTRLIFGGYPEVVLCNDLTQKREILDSIIDNHLYKDILEWEGIRKSDKILSLLRLIAFQIGKEVSLSELGAQLGLSASTVERYLDLLEKVFVIKRVFGFSRNLRKEITKNSRFYFWDNGIRNALISNYNGLEQRDDVGMLWENYLWGERMKKRDYHNIFSNIYFWRTYEQQEIDLIEEREGKLFGFELKWGSKTIKPPRLWSETYKNSEYEVINKDNYLEFIT